MATDTRIPLVDLGAQHRSLRGLLTQEFARLLDDSRFIQGEPVRNFERGFAAFAEAAGCAAVANGTDALALALRAAGLGAGDEVIVPVMTFAATAEAVTIAGGSVRFADVHPDTLVVTPDTLQAVATPRTRAVVPVHLYGQPVDVTAIDALAARNDWLVIYDAAQAHGARWEDRPITSSGAASCFSFYPGKNLGALGDGGAVVSNRPELIDRVRMLADHGRISKYEHLIEGTNSRLDALQAAFLSVKLELLPEWTNRRREVAARYRELLTDVPAVRLPSDDPRACCVYHLFVVRVADRNRVQKMMAEAGIATGVHYPIPLHLQPAYAHLGVRRGALPESEAAADEVLSLPLYPEIREEQQERVAAALRRAVRA